MLLTASMPSNWSTSSNHTHAQYPVVNLVPFSFSGSSAPRNTMRCPVGRYVSSIGDTLQRKNPSSPSAATAHTSCWYTESRSVLLKRRTTTALAKGLATMSSTRHRLMNDDLVEPRPPFSQ